MAFFPGRSARSARCNLGSVWHPVPSCPYSIVRSCYTSIHSQDAVHRASTPQRTRPCGLSRGREEMPDKKRKRPAKVVAATLGDLEGDASRRVSFLRTDARAAVPTLVPAAPLKEAFHSDLDPRWVTAAGASTAAVLSRLSADIISTVASADGAQRRAKGIHLGRASVCRLLRRRALSAAVLASDAGPPLTFAHVAVLAQESGAHVALLSCGSSHLGQQFGLLRASAIGLEAAHFPESHPFVQLIARTARPAQPLPWLDEARAAVATKAKPE